MVRDWSAPRSATGRWAPPRRTGPATSPTRPGPSPLPVRPRRLTTTPPSCTAGARTSGSPARRRPRGRAPGATRSKAAAGVRVGLPLTCSESVHAASDSRCCLRESMNSTCRKVRGSTAAGPRSGGGAPLVRASTAEGGADPCREWRSRPSPRRTAHRALGTGSRRHTRGPLDEAVESTVGQRPAQEDQRLRSEADAVAGAGATAGGGGGDGFGDDAGRRGRPSVRS